VWSAGRKTVNEMIVSAVRALFYAPTESRSGSIVPGHWPCLFARFKQSLSMWRVRVVGDESALGSSIVVLCLRVPASATDPETPRTHSTPRPTPRRASVLDAVNERCVRFDVRASTGRLRPSAGAHPANNNDDSSSNGNGSRGNRRTKQRQGQRRGRGRRVYRHEDARGTRTSRTCDARKEDAKDRERRIGKQGEKGKKTRMGGDETGTGPRGCAFPIQRTEGQDDIGAIKNAHHDRGSEGEWVEG